MKDYRDVVYNLPDGVQRTCARIQQRFCYNKHTISVSVPQQLQHENKALQQFKMRSVKPTPAPNRISRTRVARYVSMYEWTFVKLNGNPCDLACQELLYELVRGKKLSNSAIRFEEKHYLQQALTQLTSRTLESFHNGYVESLAKSLNDIEILGPLTVRARFGRTLYQINKHDVDHKLRFSGLYNYKFSKSRWSNVIHDKEPNLRAFISRLENRGALDTRLCLTICCCLTAPNGTRYAKLSFLRIEDQWVYNLGYTTIRNYGSHDITVSERTSFRVRVFSRLVQMKPSKAWWSDLPKWICFHEATNGDPFQTEVTLESFLSQNVRIDYVSVTEIGSIVKFCGLYFQLTKKRDGVSVQVLPPLKMLRKKRAGECFKFLVTKLISLLDDQGER